MCISKLNVSSKLSDTSDVVMLMNLVTEDASVSSPLRWGRDGPRYSAQSARVVGEDKSGGGQAHFMAKQSEKNKNIFYLTY